MDFSKPRSLENLKEGALLFWPAQFAEKEQKSSIIPMLIETQNKFISILHVADSSPTIWQETLINTKGMPANLFLKHLMVLSDIGGEKTKRFKTELPQIFENARMYYSWNGEKYEYRLESLEMTGSGRWDNKSLGVDGAGILVRKSLSQEMKDIAMLLMHGASSTNPGVPPEIIDKCMIGSLLGNKAELDKFVRQRYIWVSRITGGATSNAMGYLAEDYVKERLQYALPNWDFSKKRIPGISQNEGRTEINFDIVAESPAGRYCAIELSFQVTTNSVIERKAGQAQARLELLHQYGHRIAYIIDGAGNFERRSALSTILQFSDCSVTFKNDEINFLINYLKSLEE